MSGVAGANGYISKMVGSEYGLFPSETSGSSSTHYCDYFYGSTSNVRYAYVGGVSRDGLDCGAWCSYLTGTASFSNWNIGASISCKPLAQKV